MLASRHIGEKPKKNVNKMYLDWILSILTIAMNIMLGKKIKWGWIIMFILSLLWIYYALSLNPPQYGLLPAIIANLIISVPSAIKWFKEDKANQ